MFLWLVFIIVSFFWGLSISSLLNIKLFSEERAFFSLIVGHTLSIWMVFLLSYLNGSLSTGVTLFCIVICAFASVIHFSFFERKFRLFDWFDIRHWHCSKYTFSFFTFILLYLLGMNLYGVFRPDEASNIYAFLTVWGDYPFHTSVITSFAYRNNFPPIYPQFLHAEMHYPFLMDFYSAVLIKGGLDLRSSIIIPNILFQFSFFGLLYFLSYRLTGLKGVGVLSTLIFIFSGFPKFSRLESFSIHFLNPMYAVMMPQRTAMLGMAISFAVYILLFHAFFIKEEGKERILAIKELILAGVLIGLLPYIHAHSFIVTAFVSLFLSCFSVIKNPLKKGVLNLFFLFAPLILLSLPQIVSIRTQVSQDFFVFFPGWTEENRNMIIGLDWSSIGASIFSSVRTILVFLKFWLLNMGALFFLLPLGFLRAKIGLRSFYLPFLLLFFIANFVKFQPWWWDNYKILLHWHALTIVLASLAIFWISDLVRKKSGKIAALSLTSLILACTFFGAVTHVQMIKDSYIIWSSEERRIAEWIRENTPEESVFLTGSAHNHPIPALSGRKIVLGFEGWLWSHGINWTSISERKSDEIRMYKGNYTLIKEYGVDYVCVSPYEESFAIDNHFDINYSAFSDETRFYLKYDAVIDGERWRIYEVKMPNIPA